MSRRPSPSRSPVVTPFQRPTQRSSPHWAVASRSRPWSFRNSLSDPHSGARIRSGQPSPSTSEKTAADIRPTRCSRLLLASSSTNRAPPLLRYTGGAGQRQHRGLVVTRGGNVEVDLAQATALVPVVRQRAAPPRRDQQVFRAVAVDVVPCEPGAQLAQRMGKQPLSSPVVVGRVDVAVTDLGRRVPKPGR